MFVERALLLVCLAAAEPIGSLVGIGMFLTKFNTCSLVDDFLSGIRGVIADLLLYGDA